MPMEILMELEIKKTLITTRMLIMWVVPTTAILNNKLIIPVRKMTLQMMFK